MSTAESTPWDTILRELRELREENQHLRDRLEHLENALADYATTNAGFRLCLSKAHGAGPQPISEALGRFPFTNHHE